jgi:Flp pilus assembly protein TadG
VRSPFPRLSLSPRSFTGFLTSERGIATVEMALILPPALIMLGLVVMAGQGFEIERKASLAARTVTDLVSQAPYVPNPGVSGATELNQSDLDADLALSSEIMWPDSATSLQVVVSELQVNSANNTGTVVWSEPYNGATKLTVGATVTISASMVATGAKYLIYGQVQYPFQPLHIYQAVNPIILSERDMLVPRNATQITINWGD